MADKISIQIIFNETVDIKGNKMQFCDALYFDPELYEKLSQSDIDSLKKERVDNWVAVITAPQPEPVEPTEEELTSQIAELEAQVVSVQSMKEELATKLSAKQAIPKEPIEVKEELK